MFKTISAKIFLLLLFFFILFGAKPLWSWLREQNGG